ncbi:MAG: NAD-dependent epimerase/dehydratase family protein [Balneolaceae bacterium]|nr:MAG: NAD-dependent epimerase/dehydratase family protein [Balneolaceae bacterium]
MNESITHITVFGGTGMLGRPVVRELAAAGYQVTVMVRNAGRAKSKLPDEVRLVEGDLSRRKDIRTALENAEAVYLNLSTRPDVKKYDSFVAERDGLENVLAVVDELNQTGENAEHGKKEERRIKRVAAISSLVHRYQGTAGFRWWVFEIKQWADKKLREADLPVTVFYPSSFMETMDQGGIMQGQRLMLVGKSRQPMHFIAGSDYGRMVAEAFRHHDGSDQFYDIHGPEALTFDDAALEFIKNYRRGPLKITRIPMWLIKLVGTVNGEVNYLAHIMDALNNYAEPEPDPSVREKLGHPKVTLAEYARRL